MWWLLTGNSLRLYQVIQCKSEVNEAWLSPAGVFSTVASVASASFCPTSSKRGRHIEAYFPSCQGFHLRKENSHKKSDAFLFPIIILILQYPNFLPRGLLTLSKNHSWSPKRPDSLKNCMMSSFIEVYLKRKNLGRLKDNLNVQPLTGLPQLKNVLSSLCVSFQVFSLGSYRRQGGKAGMPLLWHLPFQFHQQSPPQSRLKLHKKYWIQLLRPPLKGSHEIAMSP